MAQSSGLARPLPVAEGGTGGITALTARTNLDIRGLSTGLSNAYFEDGSSGFVIDTDYSGITNDHTQLACDGSGVNLILMVKATTGDPTGAEGLLVFNTADNTLRLFASGTWLEITFT